jgi:hypothetical protein
MTKGLKTYFGIESECETACDAIELGAIRRLAQAELGKNATYDSEGDTRNSPRSRSRRTSTGVLTSTWGRWTSWRPRPMTRTSMV